MAGSKGGSKGLLRALDAALVVIGDAGIFLSTVASVRVLKAGLLGDFFGLFTVVSITLANSSASTSVRAFNCSAR